MNPYLLEYLCDPVDKSLLTLSDAKYDSSGRIVEGKLISSTGRSYPIEQGIPRFESEPAQQQAVESFGDQWNELNFFDFRLNWLQHTVKNTFGSTDMFSRKVVVDAGAGSGMQTRWIRESGAARVIALELSHSVDGIIKHNLNGLDGVDVIQCSIDRPPIKDGAIDGIVICHNVIQHTPSVEGTARALWRLVGKGGELVFNCYPKNDLGLARKARLVVYRSLRSILSSCPFSVRLKYAQIMSLIRFLPVLGYVCEKSSLMVRGDVPVGPDYMARCYKAGVLNTFDCYGAHAYQHLKTDDEIRALVSELQPDAHKVLNEEAYFLRPQPIGIALRLFR
jgi:2-polyprenyl-3-methyl-5-hydroxy-6-metoxy-1,4-benzoquinol methylase